MEGTEQTLIFPHLLKLIEEYAEKAKIIYQQKLTLDGRKATGNLINNVQTAVTFSDYVYNISFELEDYYKYVDDGRKAGKQPPREAILEWIKIKGIQARPDSKGKLPTEKQLSFLIARSIGQKGTLKEFGYGGNGGKYIAKTVEELNAQYLPKFQVALEQDWVDYSNQILQEVNDMIKI